MILSEKFGSIYIDGKPVAPCTTLPKFDPTNPPKIELGNTVPDMEISWIVVDDRLIADSNILRNVSWNLLDKSELTTGKDIQIDNHNYRVRSLEGSSGKSDWDDLLDKVLGNECLIHWAGAYSLGDDPSSHSKVAPIWGCKKATTLEFADHALQRETYGWRPVLEQKSLIACPTPDLLGESVLLYCEDGRVFSGVVAEISEYDILLERINLLGRDFILIKDLVSCKKEGNGLIFDRTTILDVFPWNIKTGQRLD